MHASENAEGKSLSMELLSPPEYDMSQRRKVSGVDVDKQFFVAALLLQSGGSTIKRFPSDKADLLEFRVDTQSNNVNWWQWNWPGSIDIHSIQHWKTRSHRIWAEPKRRG